MQQKIWDMKWDRFTPIQDQTIPIIMTTTNDVVISSATASGKTEAAFLPILSMIEERADEGLKVLYVSPLKALINNQFDRIEKLCEYNQIAIHKWHGDVTQSKKKKLIQNPTGILQITPESIESLFINRTGHIHHLFKNLEFIVIDEIHSFIGSERGAQLRSLLSRIEPYANSRPRIVGLSATIDNFSVVKDWVNYQQPDNVEIVEAKGSDKELLYHLMHFNLEEDRKKPVALFEDIRNLTRNQKAIVFCNSRGDVEESTVMLNRLAEREHVGETYYAHHSSIDKAEREYVEKSMIESKTPKSVIATSSLELGIDIGDVDIVIQIDSTFTVSSLKQRLGRSGRKMNANQILQLYTTSSDDLLQSVAVMELIVEKWIEPAQSISAPYDILFHQIISLCAETNGLNQDELLLRMKRNDVFHHIAEEDIQQIILDMIANDYLEAIKGSGEVIVGLEGERLLRSKEFYAVFMSPEEYIVLEGIRKIGAIDKTPMVNVGENIILAGKLWTIIVVDSNTNKVYVQKAVNAKRPHYSGGGVKIHERIGQKMMEIRCSKNKIAYMNDEATYALEEARAPYHHYEVNPLKRVVWENREGIIIETYTGTTIAKTLLWALRYMGVTPTKLDGVGRIFIQRSNHEIMDVLREIKDRYWKDEDFLGVTLDHERYVTKYSNFLSDNYQIAMHIENEIDIDGMKEHFNNHDYIHIRS